MTMRKLLLGALSAALLTGSAWAAEFQPSDSTIRLEQGQTACTFDITATVDEAFAGIELGLKPSADDVQLSVEFLGDYAGTGHVQTVKDGVLYFGFYQSGNDFDAGAHPFARVTCLYSGGDDRTVTLESSSVITVDETTGTTSSDRSSAPFTVTLDRQEAEKPAPGGGSGGGGGSVSPAPEEDKTPNGTTAETTENRNGQTVIEILISRKDRDESLRTGRPVELPLAPLPVQNNAILRIGTEFEGPVEVLIPVKHPTQGTVAVLVRPDGTEEVVRTCTVTDKGVVLSVEDGMTLKIADRTRTFRDVPADFWAKDYITFVTARGLYNGTTADTFSPNSPMTRGQLAKVLHNLEGQPAAKTAAVFTDVPGDLWCADAISWAAERGVVNGYADGSFRVNSQITREQLAAMLYRYAGQPETAGSLTAFSDAGSVSGFAADAMAWAVENHIIGGTADGRLNPQGTATRAQVAAMLTRFLNR